MKELLCKLFDYREGELIWKVKAAKHTRIGSSAGSKTSNGYVTITIKGRRYLRHRLIWEYHHGEIPPGMTVDHINRERSDDNIQNLRLATKREQSINRKKKSNLPCGVSRMGAGFIAQIKISGINHYLGYFKTPEEAAKTYQQKLLEIDG